MNTFMTAALPATVNTPSTTVVTTPTGAPVPTGLTAADADRIRAAIAAARAESTREVYALHWSWWERWCLARGQHGKAKRPPHPSATSRSLWVVWL